MTDSAACSGRRQAAPRKTRTWSAERGAGERPGRKGKARTPRRGSGWCTPAGSAPGQILLTSWARALWSQGDTAAEHAPRHSRAPMGAHAGPRSTGALKRHGGEGSRRGPRPPCRRCRLLPADLAAERQAVVVREGSARPELCAPGLLLPTRPGAHGEQQREGPARPLQNEFARPGLVTHQAK